MFNADDEGSNRIQLISVYVCLTAISILLALIAKDNVVLLLTGLIIFPKHFFSSILQTCRL